MTQPRETASQMLGYRIHCVGPLEVLGNGGSAELGFSVSSTRVMGFA